MNITISDELLTLIAQTTGDARSALNLLEDIVFGSEKDENNKIIVTEDTVKQMYSK